MSFVFGLVMCLCLIPVELIMLLVLYPKNWRKAKLIFGVTKRKEYCEGETEKVVDGIYVKRRRQAVMILLLSIAVGLVLVILHGISIQTALWLIAFYASLIGIMCPFFMGNREMKSLKRSLGIMNEKGVNLTDFKNVGVIRTLDKRRVLIPNITGLLIVAAALLIDLEVIKVNSSLTGQFLIFGVTALFWGVGLLMTVLAFVMDGVKNEVISEDSAINANYNRALKKNLSDLSVIFVWINVVFMLAVLLVFTFNYSEMGMLIGSLLYIAMFMMETGIYVFRNKKIENRYQNEVSVVADEDDYWIGGLFYYNPNNKRLNVKKRVVVGGTINIAHPVGKIITGIVALMLLFVVATMVYIGMAEATPIKLNIEDGQLICHHLSDDYVIDIEDIESITMREDIDSIHFVRIAGFGMDKLLKGNFTVDGESGCRVFLNPENGICIKVKTAETTYYVSAATSDETRAAYGKLQSEVNHD